MSSPCCSFGSFVDQLDDEKEKEHADNEIDTQESKEGEETIAGGDIRRRSVDGPHEIIDQPWLAARLGGNPACGVGNIGKRKSEHDDPKSPTSQEQFLAPEKKRCKK